MEQEEKENNNLETSRKRPGQDTDGEKSSFIRSCIQLIHLASAEMSLLIHCSVSALFQRSLKERKIRLSRGPQGNHAAPDQRWRSLFIFHRFMLVFSWTVFFFSSLHIFIFFSFFTGIGFYYNLWLLSQPFCFQPSSPASSNPNHWCSLQLSRKANKKHFNRTSVNIICMYQTAHTAILLDLLLVCASDILRITFIVNIQNMFLQWLDFPAVFSCTLTGSQLFLLTGGCQ